MDVCDTVALCGVGNSIGEATGVADADFDLLVTTDSDGAITTESSPTSLMMTEDTYNEEFTVMLTFVLALVVNQILKMTLT